MSNTPIKTSSQPSSNQEVVKKFQQSGRVKTVKGSILTPESGGLRFVLNLANLAGKPENPLYHLFDKRWNTVKEKVKGWHTTKTGAYKLGAVHTIPVQSDTWVVSLLCQDNQLIVQPEALKKCLVEVSKMAKYEQATIHVSSLLSQQIACLQPMLQSTMTEQGIAIFYYEGDVPAPQATKIIVAGEEQTVSNKSDKKISTTKEQINKLAAQNKKSKSNIKKTA